MASPFCRDDRNRLLLAGGSPAIPLIASPDTSKAAVDGLLIGCLYLPNGNPQPGPKFKYKLDWFRRLQAHARKLLKRGAPVVLAGDYNAVPSVFDTSSINSWKDAPLVQPQTPVAYER